MAVFEDRFIKGSRFTQHFTLDDPSNQVVPKAGTDTVPGALALNLGNNLPADTTNATDALTAAGFNAMANQVDSTDPFCGNAIQQAVTVAVGQSIACDAAAQEAIACAIASNLDAIACLAAALPSGGADCSGSVLAYTQSDGAEQLRVIKGVDGTYTQVSAVATLDDNSGAVPSWVVNVANLPFVIGMGASNAGNDDVVSYAVNTTTGALTPVTTLSLPAKSRAYAVNAAGTKVLVREGFTTFVEYSISPAGVLSGRTVLVGSYASGQFVRIMHYDSAGNVLAYLGNGDTAVVQGGTFAVLDDRVAVSPNGQFGLKTTLVSTGFGSNTLSVELYSISGTTTTLLNTYSVVDLQQFATNSSAAWAPDGTHAIVTVTNVRNNTPANPELTTTFYAEVTGTTVTLHKNRVLKDSANVTPWLYEPVFSATGKYMFAKLDLSGGYNGAVAVFKRIEDKYIQCSVIYGGNGSLSYAGTEL
jgi:hypothetical protein